jgi:hypothetical protein
MLGFFFFFLPQNIRQKKEGKFCITNIMISTNWLHPKIPWPYWHKVEVLCLLFWAGYI